MTTQIVCLLIGALLPYLWVGVTARYRKRQFGDIGLSEPRAQARQLSGAGARAWGAQMNAWEALLVFAAANGAALAAGVEPTGIGRWRRRCGWRRASCTGPSTLPGRRGCGCWPSSRAWP